MENPHLSWWTWWIFSMAIWLFCRGVYLCEISFVFSDVLTLQGINISHLRKRKIIFNMPFLRDMLVPWRVVLRNQNSEPSTVWIYAPSRHAVKDSLEECGLTQSWGECSWQCLWGPFRSYPSSPPSFCTSWLSLSSRWQISRKTSSTVTAICFQMKLGVPVWG